MPLQSDKSTPRWVTRPRAGFEFTMTAEDAGSLAKARKMRVMITAHCLQAADQTVVPDALGLAPVLDANRAIIEKRASEKFDEGDFEGNLIVLQDADFNSGELIDAPSMPLPSP